MLILSRKKDESILIGSDIEISIISVQGDQVKIGINAPKEIDVFRKELFDDTKNENREASEITLNLQQIIGELEK